MALILAAVMAVSCATTILLAASKNWANPELGSLSQYYETGTNADPGAVSNVNGDPGGVSYGLYMFSSNAGTLDGFRSWLSNQKSNNVYLNFPRSWTGHTARIPAAAARRAMARTSAPRGQQ